MLRTDDNDAPSFISNKDILALANKLYSNEYLYFYNMRDHSVIIQCINFIKIILPYCGISDKGILTSLELPKASKNNALQNSLLRAITSFVNLENKLTSTHRLDMFINDTLSLSTAWSSLLITDNMFFKQIKHRKNILNKRVYSNIWHHDILPRIIAAVYTDCFDFYNNSYMADLFREYRKNSSEHKSVLDIIATHVKNNIKLFKIKKFNNNKDTWNAILPKLEEIQNGLLRIYPININQPFDMNKITKSDLQNKKTDNAFVKETIKKYKEFSLLVLDGTSIR